MKPSIPLEGKNRNRNRQPPHRCESAEQNLPLRGRGTAAKAVVDEGLPHRFDPKGFKKRKQEEAYTGRKPSAFRPCSSSGMGLSHLSKNTKKNCHSEPARTLAWESPGFSEVFSSIRGDCHTSDVGHWFAMTVF